jgi:hypothetical protein
MKNIHLISTDKPSRLVYNDANDLCYQSNKQSKNDRKWMHRKKVNIYITSDDEPKLDEWGINLNNNVIFKCKGFASTEDTRARHKKIILTTDQDLIKDGVQAIDDEFLEWFVKNSSCEEVEIFHQDIYSMGEWDRRYKIIIPKEEPKKKHVVMLVGDGVNKQETLEEAAEKYAYTSFYGRQDLHDGFANGAKWQKERSYSEEDMIEFSKFCQTDEFESRSVNVSLLQLFKQFKKR